jgi:hypothetical protein
LRAGAARLGRGDLTQRILIKTGDEFEALADQFNSMATQLQESYANPERKIEERTHQLELANLAKSRFLAAASHDLRRPLHALTLFVAQLRDQMESSERSRLIDQINAAVVAMNELFNALLDISKLDAGALHHYAAATLLRPLRSRGNDSEADLQSTPRALLTFVARGWAVGVTRGRQMNLSSSLGAGGASSLMVLWEDGERVLCRRWPNDGNGVRTAVLAVLSASEQPTPGLVGRKDELDGRSGCGRWRLCANTTGPCCCLRIPGASRSTGFASYTNLVSSIRTSSRSMCSLIPRPAGPG